MILKNKAKNKDRAYLAVSFFEFCCISHKIPQKNTPICTIIDLDHPKMAGDKNA
jgi:hypothetical protein